MDKFWQFARQLLRHRSILAAMIGGLVLDSLCFAGGLGTLIWVITQMFNMNRSMRDIIAETINKPEVKHYLGDLSFVLDHFPHDQLRGFAVVMGVIFVLSVIGSIGRFVHQYMAITATSRTVMKIRKNVFQRIVHIPMTVVMTQGTADQLSRLVRDCIQVSRGLNALIGRAPRNIMQGIIPLGMAFVIDWKLTCVFAVILPFVGYVLYRFGRSIRRAGRRILKYNAIMVGALQECLQAQHVVKVHQAEGFERRRFNHINRTMYEREMRARFFRAMTSPVVELFAIAGVMVVTFIAYRRVQLQINTPAELFGVLMLLATSAAAFKTLGNFNNDLQDAAAAADRVDEMLHMPVEQNVRGGRDRFMPVLARHHESVAFEDVAFRYPRTERPAIREINLVVRRGQVCAIVGGNGSGKSTLVGLLPRLYEPQQGHVYIDGQDIARFSLRSLRGQMAMVTQQTILFDSTIAENLTYGMRHVSEQRMIEAAKRAYAHEFIMQTPLGYQTPLGEFGSRLSGGERQRLAIARAILRDPAILILDEATSQIDADSEAKIAQALGQFMRDRTTFVVAHRLSTVIHADMIVVMEDGRIASVGKHDELMQSSDVYRVLCQTQLHHGLNGDAPNPAASI